MKQTQRGVTLIELMIVMVVLAIIASIAVPSYRQYLMRTNRTEGTAALLQLRLAQEKFFLQNNRYATAAEMSQDLPAGLGLPAVTSHGYYTVLMVRPTPTTYSATASIAGGQLGDATCPTLTIDESGVRTAGGPVEVCWK